MKYSKQLKGLHMIFSFVLLYSCVHKNNKICHPLESGTLIIIAIGIDGIVMGSDSRANFQRNVYSDVESYRDSVQKIFPLKNIVVGISGVATYGSTNIENIIKEYNKTPYYTENAKMEFSHFCLKLSQDYPFSRYPEVWTNVILGGGYMNDKPYLMVGQHSRNSTKGVEFIGRTHSFFTNDTIAENYFSKIYKDSMDCKTLEVEIEKAIINCSKIIDTISIGGPVSILMISRGNIIKWLKNDFSNNPQGEKRWHNIVKPKHHNSPPESAHTQERLNR